MKLDRETAALRASMTAFRDQRRAEQLTELARYALASHKGLEGDRASLLSALVNLVDSARENPELFTPFLGGGQGAREDQIVAFLLSHWNE